jgi:ABC-2 type transport system ATP-binding protein
VNAVTTERLSFRYRRDNVLRDLDFAVPEACIFALLGPNGSGKTTLLKLLAGILRPQAGTASVLGVPVRALAYTDRQRISYVAEGQELPGWMRLDQLETYLAPLYPGWDAALAASLRQRFALDLTARIGAMSRGQRMKVALLCALAPRPRLVLMDEPFTGMDAMVKDDIVRGLLDSASSEGWTVLIASHDIAEVEVLADAVGIFRGPSSIQSMSMDDLHRRFRHVEVVMPDPAAALAARPRAEWLSFARSGSRLEFIDVGDGDRAGELKAAFPGATVVDVRPATLREAFVAVGRAADTRHGGQS